MSRFIDADKLEAIVTKHRRLAIHKDDILSIIAERPTADVREVVRGEWENQEDYYYDIVYRCSACHTDYCLYEGTPQENEWNFCPFCGADMRGRDNES